MAQGSPGMPLEGSRRLPGERGAAKAHAREGDGGQCGNLGIGGKGNPAMICCSAARYSDCFGKERPHKEPCSYRAHLCLVPRHVWFGLLSNF